MESRTTSPCVRASREITTRRRQSGLRRALVRTMLSLAAFLAGIWIPLGQLAADQNNEGLDVIPLNISNNVNGTPPLFVYIVGILPQSSNTFQAGDWLYVADLLGNVNITPSIPADAPISLGLNVGAGKTTQMMLPKLTAVRIYLSLGIGLLLQTNS